MDKTIVPAIRFDGFDGEWELKPFGEIVERKSAVTRVTGGLNLEFEDIVSGAGVLNKDLSSKPNNKPGVPFEVGDVLFGKLRPYLKNWLRPDFDGVAVGDFWVLRPVDADPAFVYSTIQRSDFMRVANMSSGTKMPRSDWGLVSETIFGCPSLPEQAAIGAFFSHLDTVLGAGEKKVQKLRALKQTMLTKMFPQGDSRVPEIRFEGFEGEWVPRKLNEIADIVGGGTPSTSVSDYWGGNINWYSPTEIGETVYVSESRKKITPLGFQNSSAKMLPAHTTVLFTSRAGIGNTAILSSPACTNQGFQSFVVRDNHDPYFLYSMTGKIKDLATQHAAGSTFLEISGKQLGQLSLAFPNKPEQQAIGTYFRELDTLLDAESQKLEKLRHLKSAFLSSMFV